MNTSGSRVGQLLKFIDASKTPYHAVSEIAEQLVAAGFIGLSEKNVWALAPGDKRFVARGGSIIAFEVGQAHPASAGFSLVGAHTDSPNLKLKPQASYTKSGYRQVGVEVYGGVLLATWLDRDLSVAGRISVRDGTGIKSLLVDLKDPILRIPNLAIHLNRGVNREGLTLNAQEHLPPVWGLENETQAEECLLDRVAEAASVDPETILDHDLSLYDTQPSATGGIENSFIYAARLDNLASCHSGLTAMLETGGNGANETKVLAFYDHEEVGSRSAQGAAGPFLRQVLNRVVDAVGPEAQAFERALSRSFLISADMAHAVHPNYADKHDMRHMPVIGKGPVIKTNANQSYATSGASSARFVACCADAGFAPQNFVTRTDLGCGSTIGPITAAEIGVETVDVGNPMFSMHSIREMAGTRDVDLMHKALCIFFSA